MHTELYSLSKIFTENLYRIPDYQRGYSWTTRQLKDFWSDLVLLEPNRDHYTGVLTLEEVLPKDFQRWTDDQWIIESKRYRPFFVVDGQQRLTTALILLQVLLEQVKEEVTLNYSATAEIRKKYIFESRDRGVSRSYIFGYEKDNPSYEFLKTRIFLERSDNHEVGEQTIYTHNLLQAKEYFEGKLKGLGHTQLEMVFTKLTQHFLFNIYTMTPGIEVFVAFETMNNRGKPLSNLELLKNRLIFLSTRLGADATERSKVRSVVNEAWKTAYHYLGRNQKQPLDDDQFLMVHFSLYVGESLYDENNKDARSAKLHNLLRRDEYKSYLLDELFTSRNIPRISGEDAKVLGETEERRAGPALSTEALYAYAHDLKSCVQVYYRIRNPDDSELPGQQKVALAQINRLGWYDAMPLGLAVALTTKKPEATDLFAQLERYLFLRHFMAYPRRSAELDLLELAVRVKKGQVSITDVATRLRVCPIRVGQLHRMGYANPTIPQRPDRRTMGAC